MNALRRSRSGVKTASMSLAVVLLEQRVVDLAAVVDAVALALLAGEVHDLGQCGDERREVVVLAGLLPALLRFGLRLGERLDEIVGELGRQVVIAAHLADVGRFGAALVVELRVLLALGDQITDLLARLALVDDPREGRCLLGACLGAGRGHVGLLIPAHQCADRSEHPGLAFEGN